MPLSLGTLVAILMMGNVISCNGCKSDKNNSESGTLVITSNKNNLKGKTDREVEITVKGTEDDKPGVISNFKMKVNIQRTGGTSGESELEFTQTNEGSTTKVVSIKDNETDEAKELGYFFSLNGKTNLSDSESEALKTKFIFNPGKDVVQLVVTFELVDQNGNTVGTPCSVTWEEETAGTFTLAVDKDDIKDGATKITVTVAAGGAEVKKENLDKLTLKIKREVGAHATLQGANATAGKVDEFTYAFTAGANELQIATDKKSATKELTIVPGKDKDAKFNLTLLDKDGQDISTAKQTVTWKDGVKIKVNKLEYNNASQQIEYEIVNDGASATVDIKLSWEGEKGVNVVVNNKKEGNVTLKLEGATKTVQGKLPVGWDTDTYASFKFIVKHNGEVVYDQDLSFAKIAPKLTIGLKDPGVTEFIGDSKKQVTFVITAGTEELSEKDLQATKLDYSAVHGGRLLHGTEDARDNKISLHTLLGVDRLLAGASKEVVLTIDNDKKAAVTFTNIKIKGSDKEDDDANKVKEIKWKGEIKVKVAGHDGTNVVDLTQLTGDAGKTVPLQFTNGSGFDLEEADLKKVFIGLNNLTGGASVNVDANEIRNGTTTLWNILGAKLAAGADVDKNLTIVSGTNRAINFTLTLAGENTLNANHEVDVNWKGEIKVKVESTGVDLAQLTGDAGKTVPLQFINESGFDLEKADLKKVAIVINNLTGGASVNYGANDIQSRTTTLWAILGDKLAAGTPANKDLTIKSGTNKSVTFELALGGTNKATTNHAVNVNWEGEIKVKVEGRGNLNQLKGDAGKTVPLQFTNESPFNLKQADLEKVVINLNSLTGGASVSYGANNIQSGTTTLWNILGAELISGTPQDKNLTIVPGTNELVEFALIFGGANKSHDHTVHVNWQVENKPKVSILNADDQIQLLKDNKKFTLQFKNGGTVDLDATALADMKVEIDGIGKSGQITYHNGAKDVVIETGKTTLADLLKNQGLNAGVTMDVEFTIDTGKDQGSWGKKNEVTYLKFIVGIINSGSTDVKRNVHWNDKTINLTFEGLENFKGEDEVKFRIKNKGDKVKQGNISIKLESIDADMNFTLGRKQGVKSGEVISLSTILNSSSDSDLVHDWPTNDIVLKVTGEGKKHPATITLTVICDGKEEKQQIEWQAKELKIAFEGLNNFEGDEKVKFTIKNTGDAVKRSQIYVTLESTETDMEFDLGNYGGITSGASYALGSIIPGTSNIPLGPHMYGDTIELQVVDAKEKKSSTITLTVTYNGKEVCKKQVQWTAKKS
ncbi:MAG: hypothetical protein BGO68_01010 [Candidatus Amoebophilus sp. 36-38]|nr:MAG: hypothetical protein BGO68_01010 [Candidatus Amoebophilus sp. 36-38]